MGGLTSSKFLYCREQLCRDFDIDLSKHNKINGRNKNLDEFLSRQTLLTDEPSFQSIFLLNGRSKEAVIGELSYERLIYVMCYIGYGSTVLHVKRPDLEILGLIIRGLLYLAKTVTLGETLIQERKRDRQGDVIFRLIRPFFCHDFVEAVVAILGTHLCRSYWNERWPTLECTLAALYRYIPRGRKAAPLVPVANKLLKVINAAAQVGLQGQSIESRIIGTLQQHLYLAKKQRSSAMWTPNHLQRQHTRKAERQVAFDDFDCFKMNLPYNDAERVFKELVEIGEEAFELFTNYFKDLVCEVPLAEFLVNPPLGEEEARKKRNKIYAKLGGKGDPWSHISWNAEKSRKNKTCDPNLGWKACMLIHDYLSGTINCLGHTVLKHVRMKFNNSSAFTICKTINKLNTSSRDLVCIGSLELGNPEIKKKFREITYHFTGNKEKIPIDVFLVTLRIRLHTPILGYCDYYDHLRQNHLLNSLWSSEELFTLRLCKAKEKTRTRRLKSQSAPEQMRMSMLNLLKFPGQALCPENHSLCQMPAPYTDHQCAGCKKILEQTSIMHYCITCDWLLCSSCFCTKPGKREKSKSYSKRKNLDAMSFSSNLVRKREDEVHLEELAINHENSASIKENTKERTPKSKKRRNRGFPSKTSPYLSMSPSKKSQSIIELPSKPSHTRRTTLSAISTASSSSSSSLVPEKPNPMYTVYSLIECDSSEEFKGEERPKKKARPECYTSDSVIHLTEGFDSNASCVLPQPFNYASNNSIGRATPEIIYVGKKRRLSKQYNVIDRNWL